MKREIQQMFNVIVPADFGACVPGFVTAKGFVGPAPGHHLPQACGQAGGVALAAFVLVIGRQHGIAGIGQRLGEGAGLLSAPR